MYCINYLFWAGAFISDIVCVYTSIIRSILEYACHVWHPGLTKKLSKDIECVQKRLFPALPYTESLRKSGLERLDNRRDMITVKGVFWVFNFSKQALCDDHTKQLV